MNFTLLSNYAPSLLSNLINEMSRFVNGVSDLVKEECHTTILHDDMNISRLMVYAQSTRESKLKKMTRHLKRDASDEKCMFSKVSSQVEDVLYLTRKEHVPILVNKLLVGIIWPVQHMSVSNLLHYSNTSQHIQLQSLLNP